MFMDETYVPLAPKIEEVKDAYIIKEGDELSLKVYSRSGINLIDVLKENTITGASQAANYLVDMNGMVDIPILGYYKVKGLKEAELKSKLEAEFEKLFNNPYVVVKVENRRAFVFKGSEAAVVSLNKAPTNLIEVLAKSGGLSSDMKASNIKIIRGNLKKPEVYQVDLSTMKGLTSADLTIQTNDIIYIEERQRPTYKMLTEVIPLVSLPLSIISSIVSIIVISNR
jgi:polysaccharide export outer membrane protein